MDYQYKTTFWSDFSLAEAYGVEAVEDTAKRAFDEWKDDIVYLTELVMILNHKCWYHYQENDVLSETYERLYYLYDSMAYDYLEQHNPDGLDYYFKTLD